MIKKLKIAASFIMPLFFTIIIFIFFNKEFQKNNLEEEIEKKEKTIAFYKNYIESKKNILKDDFYVGLKLIKDDKIVNFDELDKSKQEVFKLCLLYKAFKDLKIKAKSSDIIDKKSIDDINDLIKDINDDIEKHKKKLYNLYNDNIHPLDKTFLENLNVYLLN